MLPVNIEIVEKAALLWTVDHDSAFTFARQQSLPVCMLFSKDHDDLCRKFEKSLAKAKSVLEQFVLIWVDGETENPLVDEYDVAAYPAVLLLDSSGTLLKRISGYASPTIFRREIKNIRKSKGVKKK